MADTTIGIDLGTTYSCAAIVENDKPRVLKSRLGYATIPSIIAFDGAGKPVVGQAAERQMILHPEQTLYGSKRLLGRNFLSGLRAKFQPHFHYELTAGDDGLVAARIHDRVVPLVEAAALILREIRVAAETTLQRPVDRAVVTVPAYFGDTQRACVREAGARAELDIIRTLNEPTAAALCFGATHDKSQRLLVFDLGGGTFDVSIVNVEGNIFEVAAVDGDTFLGGLDFDQCLVELVIERLEAKTRSDVSLGAVDKERLRAAAQEVKHQLSVQNKAFLSVPQLHLTGGSRLDVAEPITREELEAASAALVDTTLEVVKHALEAAHLEPRDIDEVLLVGGQTRMPIVRDRLGDLFGREPNKRVHPDEVVALGAAICAHSHDQFNAPVLLDVVPVPIGIGAPGGVFKELIPRNSPLPHDASTTVKIPPACPKLIVPVFQGDRLRAQDNDYLGAIVLDGMRTSRELDCTLDFHVNAECLLTVHARIPGVGIDRKVELATQQTPDEVLEARGAERVRAAPSTASAAGRASDAAKAKAKPAAAPERRGGLLSRLFGLFRRR